MILTNLFLALRRPLAGTLLAALGATALNAQAATVLNSYVAGTNLTNRPQVSYQGYAQFVEDSSWSGRKITVGLEYSF